MLKEVFETLLNISEGVIPLPSGNITQAGSYLLFDGCQDFGSDVESYAYKIFVAGHSLEASDYGIINEVERILNILSSTKLPDITISLKNVSLSQLSEGLFVYEIQILLRVRR